LFLFQGEQVHASIPGYLFSALLCYECFMFSAMPGRGESSIHSPRAFHMLYLAQCQGWIQSRTRQTVLLPSWGDIEGGIDFEASSKDNSQTFFPALSDK
jgi:hypothetical protein